MPLMYEAHGRKKHSIMSFQSVKASKRRSVYVEPSDHPPRPLHPRSPGCRRYIPTLGMILGNAISGVGIGVGYTLEQFK